MALLLACFDCDAPSPAATAHSVSSPSPPSPSHTPHSVDDVRSVGAGGGGDSAEEAGGVQDSVKELRQGGGFSSARFVGRVWLDGGRVVLPEGRQVRGIGEVRDGADRETIFVGMVHCSREQAVVRSLGQLCHCGRSL